VEVPNQLLEVRLLVDDDGFVPVLKEMARTLMTAVEGSGIAGEETP